MFVLSVVIRERQVWQTAKENIRFPIFFLVLFSQGDIAVVYHNTAKSLSSNPAMHAAISDGITEKRLSGKV